MVEPSPISQERKISTPSISQKQFSIEVWIGECDDSALSDARNVFIFEDCYDVKVTLSLPTTTWTVYGIDPLSKAESYQYDLAGNLTFFRDRKLQATTYLYDALNRRTNVTYADGSSTAYVYDKGNRLTSITDFIARQIIRGYDALDRLTSEQTPQGTVSYT